MHVTSQLMPRPPLARGGAMAIAPSCPQPTLCRWRYAPHVVNEVVVPWGSNPGLSGSRGRILSTVRASAALPGGLCVQSPCLWLLWFAGFSSRHDSLGTEWAPCCDAGACQNLGLGPEIALT